MARAICGRARRTEAATFASSALTIRAISSADFRSRSAETGLGRSVVRSCRRRGFMRSRRFSFLANIVRYRLRGGCTSRQKALYRKGREGGAKDAKESRLLLG